MKEILTDNKITNGISNQTTDSQIKNKMRKSFIPFLLAGVLSTTSCTESFEPTVDYGDQTHINDYSALLAAVNNLNKSMSERFEALNQLLDKNLADIKLSIDENTGAIKAIGDNVDTINTTLLNGFSALNTQIDATGKQIVYAINENGEMLRLEIDANGKLISSKIEALDASLKAIVDAINSQTTKLEAKFDGLNTLIKQGFVDVIAKIGAVGDELHLDLTKIDEKLGKIDADMLAGFTLIEKKLDASGNEAIIEAINKNGDKLELVINKNGEVISGKIDDFKDAYTTNEALELAKMGEIIDAIKALEAANNANSAEMIARLKEILARNQIYTTNNPQELYMSPEKFQKIEEAGKDSNIYKLYLDQIKDVYTPLLDSRQVVDEDAFNLGNESSTPPQGGGTDKDDITHDHAIFKHEFEKDELILLSEEVKKTDLPNGLLQVPAGVQVPDRLVRVVKSALSCSYSLTIDSDPASGNCGFVQIYKIKIYDAEDPVNGRYLNSEGKVVQDSDPFSTTAYNVSFKMVVYNQATRKLMPKIKAFAYCKQVGGTN